MKPSAAKNPPPIALRPAAPPDETFLIRLYATTRATELTRTGWNAAQQDEFIRSQYHLRRADYAARHPGFEHTILILDGQDIGAWMVARGHDHLLLINIELLPAHRSRGIGSALIRRLFAEAKIARIPVRLSVREDNLAATRLYRRLGFALAARANGYLRLEHKP
ncbi:MAG: GNAT family N-acetyltransferase [Burkholderiales bacterium]|nr:GNAT family N-acetyltransferase [Opitutaceae bacterium]